MNARQLMSILVSIQYYSHPVRAAAFLRAWTKPGTPKSTRSYDYIYVECPGGGLSIVFSRAMRCVVRGLSEVRSKGEKGYT